MEDTIKGKVFVVGDNIDTDQIIPAEYLSYNPAIAEERKFFGKYAMSGVPAAQSGLPGGNVPFVEPDKFTSEFSLIVAGRNFGCGSSREHAPLAIAEAGVRAVVAESYARIFYRNCINTGLLPVECQVQAEDGDELTVDFAKGVIRNVTRDREWSFAPFPRFVQELIDKGGLMAKIKEEKRCSK